MNKFPRTPESLAQQREDAYKAFRAKILRALQLLDYELKTIKELEDAYENSPTTKQDSNS